MAVNLRVRVSRTRRRHRHRVELEVESFRATQAALARACAANRPVAV